MHTPLKAGDRVHNVIQGQGCVQGFTYPEGMGEHVLVLWDDDPDQVYSVNRRLLRRVLGTTSTGSLMLGGA